MHSPPPQNIIAYLLLRDGHTVPITSLHPDCLKQSRKALLRYGDVPLKHTTGLNAIVKRLGFTGDFGTYKKEHWPTLENLLTSQGLVRRADLFSPTSVPYLGIQFMTKVRRTFADRFFAEGLDEHRRPKRVFTGYGFDWAEFDGLHAGFQMPNYDEGCDLENLSRVREWLYSRRLSLFHMHSFLSDHLLEVARPEPDVVMLYSGPNAVDTDNVEHDRAVAALDAFRWFIRQRSDGWVDVHPLNERLALLVGPNGLYDFIWKDTRLNPPPSFQDGEVFETTAHFRTWYYYQQDRWEERDRHESEVRYYGEGGVVGDYPSAETILRSHLCSEGAYVIPSVSTAPKLPIPVTRVELDDLNSLWVSPLITRADFEEFAATTEFFDAISSDGVELYEAANWDCQADEPVSVTWRWAVAYCAWLDRSHGVPCRLFSRVEHRRIRPFALGLDGSNHYARLRFMDFPWEHRPPRYGLESALEWSVSRYVGLNGSSELGDVRSDIERRWIPQADWPPKSKLIEDIPWQQYEGLDFIDAWDVYEWCDDSFVAGRYWEGPVGADSCGEYKALRANFRVVVQGGAR